MTDCEAGVFEYPDPWTPKHVEELAQQPELDEVAFFEEVSVDVLQAVEDLILAKRPEVGFRLYGFYRTQCDLSLLQHVPSVRKLTVNCLETATNPDALGQLPNLTELQVGILDLKDFSFLGGVPETLRNLALEATTSKKPSLRPLERFRGLHHLYLEGHSRDIGVIGSLTFLKDLTLRSVTVPSLSFLQGLEDLSSLSLKLGGTTNLDALSSVPGLKFLELWQVRKLSDLHVLLDLFSLQCLLLQSLPNVSELPSFAPLNQLRRVVLENMKGLRNLTPLADAPHLEELVFIQAANCAPDDFECLLGHPTLQRLWVGFGSDKRNNALRKRTEAAGKEFAHPGAFAFR